MNRHYDGERVREVLGKLRRIQRSDGITLNIGADLILGFPGETDADFQDTLALVEDFQITQLHAFPFSGHIDHYSVPAGKFPDQVPNHIAQQRTKTLIASGKQQTKQFSQSEIRKTLKVLIEKCDMNGNFSGWSENYLACSQENFLPHKNQKIQR